ncbi:unannotated protein [freshwater metagenome]|uniref:Unannotated protein n=1 Tax=freshwater metagenome TaxID=449393 RepID=A0A6J7JIN6_9ZZZZ
MGGWVGAALGKQVMAADHDCKPAGHHVLNLLRIQNSANLAEADPIHLRGRATSEEVCAVAQG